MPQIFTASTIFNHDGHPLRSGRPEKMQASHLARLSLAPDARQNVLKQSMALLTEEVSEAKTVVSSAYIDMRTSEGGDVGRGIPLKIRLCLIRIERGWMHSA